MQEYLNSKRFRIRELERSISRAAGNLINATHKQDLINALAKVSSGPNLKARDVMKALAAVKDQHEDFNALNAIKVVNASSPSQGNARRIKMRAMAIIDKLAALYGFPTAILPRVEIIDDEKFKYAGQYNGNKNIIFISLKCAKTRKDLETIVAHEIRHFEDELRERQLFCEDTNLGFQSQRAFARKFARDMREGRDLAFHGWEFIKTEAGIYATMPKVRIDPIQRLCRQLIQEEAQRSEYSSFGYVDIDFQIEDIDGFWKRHSSKFEALCKDAKSRTRARKMIENEIRSFNTGDARDKYCYLTKLDAAEKKQIIRKFTGSLQNAIACSKDGKPDYTERLYLFNESECSARLFESAQRLKTLLDPKTTQGKGLREILKQRDPSKPIDEQTDDWIKVLRSSIEGEELFLLALHARAESLRLQISRDIRANGVKEILRGMKSLKKPAKLQELEFKIGNLEPNTLVPPLYKIKEVDNRYIDFEDCFGPGSFSTDNRRSRFLDNSSMPKSQRYTLKGLEKLRDQYVENPDPNLLTTIKSIQRNSQYGNYRDASQLVEEALRCIQG